MVEGDSRASPGTIVAFPPPYPGVSLGGGGYMHKVFGNEGGFGDRELRIIRSALKQRAHWEPSLTGPNKKSARGAPLPRRKRDKAA